MYENYFDKANLNIVRKVNLKQARQYEILPLYEEDNKIFILSTNKDKLFNQYIKFLFNEKELKAIVVSNLEIHKYIDKFLGYNVLNLEEDIITLAVSLRVSDIHLEPMNHYLKIRFRLNGSLTTVFKITIEEYFEVLSRLKLKSKMDITEKRRPQDGKMQVNINGLDYNCRLSTLPVVDGEKMVIRIIYEDILLSSLKNLNFTNNQIQVLEKIINLKSGICIINGPTGSGKSTTLYNILNSIKTQNINITTLEDPIEVIMEGINQINLNEKIGLDFGEGLKRILRQDPDVIMVGEIRDELTAKMAIRAAITGHKVYSTIHTKNPKGVYLRLEEMGVQDYLIKDALCGIISQRLVKILCPKCKMQHIFNGMRVFKKKGCIYCNGTGYFGRKVVASVNYINNIIKIKEMESMLSNKEMIKGLKDLLLNGYIDYFDFLSFIEEEEIDEEELFRSSNHC